MAFESMTVMEISCCVKGDAAATFNCFSNVHFCFSIFNFLVYNISISQPFSLLLPQF